MFLGGATVLLKAFERWLKSDKDVRDHLLRARCGLESKCVHACLRSRVNVCEFEISEFICIHPEDTLHRISRA